MKSVKIIPNKHGYYELWIDGEHVGNYDSPEDARADINET